MALTDVGRKIVIYSVSNLCMSVHISNIERQSAARVCKKCIN